MSYSLSFYQSLSEEPGVYFFLDEKGKVLYIGKAKNLKKRVSSYFLKKAELGQRTKVLVCRTKNIRTIKTNSEIESLLLEASSIKKYAPEFNVKLTDGKAYPLIRITIKDKYPSVLIERRADDKDSLYFGPFPNAGSMKLVLKIIRKIFPFQSTRNHPKKICLYNHLGLCPCPPVFDSKEFREEYKKNTKHIIRFLSGKINNVVSGLKKEIKLYVKKEEFEEAQKTQTKINAINLITHNAISAFDYEQNPNLASDLRIKELDELESILKKNNINVNHLHKIECYDISNIMGKKATGSLVVFIDGEKDKTRYRRFKIQKKGPNDFAMIEEVMERRLNHPDWNLPNLMIIDGGKGQVNAALKILMKKKLSLPVIGLAKREETIITSDLEEIKLSKNSPALHLLMRIRDEAHRFAITYHKKLRSSFLQGT